MLQYINLCKPQSAVLSSAVFSRVGKNKNTRRLIVLKYQKLQVMAFTYCSGQFWCLTAVKNTHGRFPSTALNAETSLQSLFLMFRGLSDDDKIILPIIDGSI